MGRRLENAQKYYRLQDGACVYVGDLIASTLPAAEQSALFRRIAASAAALAVCVIVMGCIPVPGMQQGPWVIPFYVGQVAMSLRLGWAVFRLGRADWGAIRAYDFTATAGVLSPGSAIVLFLTAAAGVGEGIYLGRHGAQGRPAAAAAFFLLQLTVAVLAWQVRKTARSLSWKRAGGETPPPQDGQTPPPGHRA